MGKRVTINACRDCPFFERVGSGPHCCHRAYGDIADDGNIPAWCPLPDESAATRAEEVERLAERLFVHTQPSENGRPYFIVNAFGEAEAFIAERDRRRAEREGQA